MTVLDLLSRAARLLNVKNIGDPLDGFEQQSGLLALNAMVDAWALERLMMFTTTRTVYAYVAGIQQYAVGPNATGNDWNGPRPPYLDGAGLIIQDGSGSERPLGLIANDDDWKQVRIKNLPSTLPTLLYYQPDFANGSATCVLWPAPTQSGQVALYAPVAIAQFASINQTVSLPPGYARALPFNLAVEWAPDFDREASATVQAIAMDAKTKIKQRNFPSAIGKMRAPEATAIGKRRGGYFDYLTGDLR